MLKILINAYACSPHMGSEPGMAWNWCIHLAKYCELHVITEGEFKDKIEAELPKLPQAKNLHFYYSPVPERVREMCWNQGDWRFYKHYQDWQWKTYQIALGIVQQTPIDIIHQLNMIGFREPGYLWKIKQIPFVWGPIGGLKQFPIRYLTSGSLKIVMYFILKNCLNILQVKYNKRIRLAFQSSSILVSSIPNSYVAIKKYIGKDSILIPETGCYPSNSIPFDRFDKSDFNVLWVGKFDFRKQLHLALEALALSNNKRVILNIFGTGNERTLMKYQKLCDNLGISEQVIWHGIKSNEIILSIMRSAQLLFFTSVSEDTSTVVLEALSNQLPVLCFDSCGFGAIIDEKVGIKISLTNPSQSVHDFAQALNYLESNRDILKELSANCVARQRELSWDNKALQMLNLYQECLSKTSSKSEEIA
ncbi:glycosyltransferase involved in cell wall biosynthesis [Runella defluvii]|uniref:Glycosyltransferase involved in cell wall biosynthesis n=1 Tax=Runella defluvii TaxID=370973 RepID=A0A7W5ZLL3_9BACT|nr:glycosyltransferase [Runella defluvii]MBB3839613.1 glycosyltransferase involved in cell wall biosynthesis [Runella defluvii]